MLFECSFSAKVWLNVLKVADFPSISPVWNDIMGWLIPLSKHDDAQSIVGRLIVAASSYFIWQERNNRIHNKGEKTVDQVTNVVADVVRLKLASITFKKNMHVDKLKSTWKLSARVPIGG